MKSKPRQLFLSVLGVILLINLVQSYFTQLIFDETYYWHYAQQMAWGYFDHPPMVAVLVKLGSLFFEGELGVRIMSCLLSAGTFVLLWCLIDTPKKNSYIPHFFVLVYSMTLLHAYGFLTLPDTPLLFFTALFLLTYKKFIDNPSLLKALLLGAVMAALMYSKYHAVLVIFFVFLSNVKLVFNNYFWIAVVAALLCYTPHFIWLAEHNFVTIKYHLFERPNQPYHFEKFSLGFLINLVVIFGLTFPFVYWSLWKTKAKDSFTKALLYLIYGIVLFFFISSFQRRVQTQWIIVICIPMAVIAYSYMLRDPFTRKWILRMGMINIVILLFLRIGLVYQPLFPVVYETHGNREWVAKVSEEAGEAPVVFEDSYRRAPMYAFYSGNPSFSFNTNMYRQNQYSIDDSERRVQHQRVLYISPLIEEGDFSYASPKGTLFCGEYIDDFESYRKLRCYVQKTGNKETKGEILLKVYNPYGTNIDLKKIKFGVAYQNAYKKVQETQEILPRAATSGIDSLKARDTTKFYIRLPGPKEIAQPDSYKICISENGLSWGLNGETIKL